MRELDVSLSHSGAPRRRDDGALRRRSLKPTPRRGGRHAAAYRIESQGVVIVSTTPATPPSAEALATFKANQRAGWAHFGPLAMFTTAPAARLVRFAGVKPGQRVLDVGCGTGVAAVTAARAGARVTGSDLTPELLALAH